MVQVIGHCVIVADADADLCQRKLKIFASQTEKKRKKKKAAALEIISVFNYYSIFFS